MSFSCRDDLFNGLSFHLASGGAMAGVDDKLCHVATSQLLWEFFFVERFDLRKKIGSSSAGVGEHIFRGSKLMGCS